MTTFMAFDKIPRLSRDCVITEKIDGTNAQIFWDELEVDQVTYEANNGTPMLYTYIDEVKCALWVGSRNRWLRAGEDNFGFRDWVNKNWEHLTSLGIGRHFGEWWGSGIQRGYGLQNGEKRFSLFNVRRWAPDRDKDKFPQGAPECCSVVPVLYRGMFDTGTAEWVLGRLQEEGSIVSPGFMKPEGIVIYHTAAGQLFKKTIEKDEAPKGA
jgi:hypothetical protein